MQTIETSRLILRTWALDDADDMYEFACNPKIGPSAGWKPHESLEESQQIIKLFMEHDEVWAIVDKMSGKVIGSIGIHQDKKRDPDMQKIRSLGYVLSENFWGKGLVPEAARAVISYAFDVLELELLTVFHFPFNVNSKRVIEKLGFVYEGTLRMGSVIFDGSVYDSVCYSMTRAEYKKTKNA